MHIKKKYEWLEVMRGFAAVWVLLHHAHLTTSAFHSDFGSVFFARGHLGVDFFFILSGFIISYSVSRMMSEERGIKEYLTARCFRIYLPYLPIGVGLYLAYMLFPNLSAADRDIGFFTSLTLFPTEETTALSVAWTLKHELLFYVLFSFVFLSRRVGMAVLSVWFVSVIVSTLMEIRCESPLLKVAMHPLNLWFLVGMLVYQLPKNSLKPLYVYISLAVLAVILYALVVSEANRAYVGMILAAMVYIFTKSEVEIVRPSSFMLFFGAASYSIYLVHNPVQSLLARIPGLISVNLDVAAYFLFVAAGSLVVGLVYYLLVESSLMQWSRAFMKNVSTKASVSGRNAVAEEKV